MNMVDIFCILMCFVLLYATNAVRLIIASGHANAQHTHTHSHTSQQHLTTTRNTMEICPLTFCVILLARFIVQTHTLVQKQTKLKVCTDNKYNPD